MPNATRACKRPKIADMTHRHLFLIGYDIKSNSRRCKALRQVQPHAMGGQKSFYECWLTVSELQELLGRLKNGIEGEADRVVIVRLDARTQSITLGQAESIANTDYFHIA